MLTSLSANQSYLYIGKAFKQETQGTCKNKYSLMILTWKKFLNNLYTLFSGYYT